jgi:hypothetical protein
MRFITGLIFLIHQLTVMSMNNGRLEYFYQNYKVYTCTIAIVIYNCILGARASPVLLDL